MNSRIPPEVRTMIFDFNDQERKRMCSSSAFREKEVRDIRSLLDTINRKKQWTPAEMISYLEKLKKYGITIENGGKHWKICHDGKYHQPLARRANGSETIVENYVKNIQRLVNKVLEKALAELED